MLPIAFVQDSETFKILAVIDGVTCKNGSMAYCLTYYNDGSKVYHRSLDCIRHTLNKYARNNSLNDYRITLR